jgi:hypothetical protein
MAVIWVGGRGEAQTFEVAHQLLGDEYRLSDNIYHTWQLVQTTSLRNTTLSSLARWKPVAWPRGAIAFDASLVDDVNHAGLAVLPAARTSRAIALTIGRKMPIARLTCTIGPIASLAYDIDHSG